MIQRVDSDRPPVQIAESLTRMTPSTWSPDGRQLTFYEFPTNRISVVSVSLDGAGQSPPQQLSFVASSHDRSPDGRWLVYSGEGISVVRCPWASRSRRSLTWVLNRNGARRVMRSCFETATAGSAPR